ncbi:hypothetical protein DMB65_21645 [Flavobacterium cheongpyeongense]|uniref:Uncharacterized protein n=1 Tax=Flavobacterium cheongpyeongense TaxID=2212651 RepID=A0A2V4BI90_9FLAO|nr:hypothetical protein [Flavobacterium cheongpyeongense]PXY38686.1 hypothetical protein DMB65_21645 [Flavobacterium cheongpyeongense]
MKKIRIFGVCVVMFSILTCQKEDNQREVVPLLVSQNENWLSANLDAKFASSQKQVAAYLFSTDEMKLLIQKPNIAEVHFVMGFNDDKIQIQVSGVDESGTELGTVKSAILKESNFRTELTNLNQLSVNTTNKRTPLLNSHLLSPDNAFKWIKEWQGKLKVVSDLEKITSHEGSRFRYFSLEPEVIKAMLYKDYVNIGLFLGLNPKGKVTAILIGLDQNNAVKKIAINPKEANDIYDGTRPCPPCIDEETEEQINRK